VNYFALRNRGGNQRAVCVKVTEVIEVIGNQLGAGLPLAKSMWEQEHREGSNRLRGCGGLPGQVGEDNAEEEQIFETSGEDEAQREVVMEVLKADCEVRRGRPPGH
jgi:hypothetical protein